MIILNAKEKSFLKEEFKMSDNEISSISKEKWLELREKCFDIEVEESAKAAESNNEDYVMPEREVIAVHLAEKSLSALGLE